MHCCNASPTTDSMFSLMCLCMYSLMPFDDMDKSFLVLTTLLLLSEMTMSSAIPPPEVNSRVIEKVQLTCIPDISEH